MRVALILTVLAAGLVLVTPRLLSAYFTDTEYAPGYTEKGFDSVAVGDTRAQVLRALGAPLSSHASTPTTEWLYCDETHPGFSVQRSYSGTFSLITFELGGAVTAAWGQTETGRSSSPFGSSITTTMDGGPLGLPTNFMSDDPNPLIGLSEAEILAKYGQPRHVFDDTTTETLVYSRSPSSTHYQWRRIGIDGSGRVAEKQAYFYWD